MAFSYATKGEEVCSTRISDNINLEITTEVGEMEVKFNYYHSGIGWATCIFEVNGQVNQRELFGISS